MENNMNRAVGFKNLKELGLAKFNPQHSDT